MREYVNFRNLARAAALGAAATAMAAPGMDTSRGDAREMMSLLYHADIRCFLVHYNRDFPYDLFARPAFHAKPVMAFFGSAGERQLPNLYMVRPDFPAMVSAAMAILDELRPGRGPRSRDVVVQPRLIGRRTSGG